MKVLKFNFNSVFIEFKEPKGDLTELKMIFD